MRAEDRREVIVRAAIHEFAARGLHGGSTERIAKAAGISQPYVFRLFETKNALFLAALGHVIDRIETAFRQGAASDPDHPLKGMALAFEKLKRDRDDLRVLLQGFAVAAEPEFNPTILGYMERLGLTVEELSGAEKPVIKEFFAYGMLHIVTAAMGKELDFDCD